MRFSISTMPMRPVSAERMSVSGSTFMIMRPRSAWLSDSPLTRAQTVSGSPSVTTPNGYAVLQPQAQLHLGELLAGAMPKSSRVIRSCAIDFASVAAKSSREMCSESRYSSSEEVPLERRRRLNSRCAAPLAIGHRDRGRFALCATIVSSMSWSKARLKTGSCANSSRERTGTRRAFTGVPSTRATRSGGRSRRCRGGG